MTEASSIKKISLRGIGIIGILLFVPLFLLTFADPQAIEKSASGFIEWKLQKETNEKIDAIRLPTPSKLENLLHGKARELQREAEKRIADLKQQLKEDAPAIQAAQIAMLRNLDCECRKRWEQKLRNTMQFEIIALEVARAKLEEFTQAKYMQIVVKLTRDVRIFLGVNAFIFIFLFLISFLKPQAIRHLFLPGSLMLVSTIICSYFYLFEQNWFLTILFDSYTGYGFVGYLLFVFLILCDIAFNKARITTGIINTFLHITRQVADVSPC